MLETNGFPVLRIRVIDIFNHKMKSDRYNDNFISNMKSAFTKLISDGAKPKAAGLMEQMVKNIPDRRKNIKNELTIVADIETVLEFIISLYNSLDKKAEKLDGKNLYLKIDKLAVNICIRYILIKFVTELMKAKEESPNLHFKMQDLEFIRQVLEVGLYDTKCLVDSWYIYHDAVVDNDKALDIFVVKDTKCNTIPPEERV